MFSRDGGVRVGQVRHRREGSASLAIAAQGGVDPIEVETPRAIGGGEAGQECAVEARLDQLAADVTGATPAFEVERPLHLDRGVDRDPHENRVDVERPVAGAVGRGGCPAGLLAAEARGRGGHGGRERVGHCKRDRGLRRLCLGDAGKGKHQGRRGRTNDE